MIRAVPPQLGTTKGIRRPGSNVPMGSYWHEADLSLSSALAVKANVRIAARAK